MLKEGKRPFDPQHHLHLPANETDQFARTDNVLASQNVGLHSMRNAASSIF
jgi:hypothetical protein